MTLPLVSIETVPPGAIDDLLDRAFGPDRRTRTAYRLRAGTSPIADLSFAALAETRLIGSIQCWPVRFVGDDGRLVPMVLMGPVAVEPSLQRGGIGRELTRSALAAATRRGDKAIMLIGDPDYYGRFFGFTADRTRQWRLPGPVEPHRLLAHGDAVPDGAGTIEPDCAA
ncbi:MAG: GNAT family N-acetyltransferase [Sphingomonas sp.]